MSIVVGLVPGFEVVITRPHHPIEIGENREGAAGERMTVSFSDNVPSSVVSQIDAWVNIQTGALRVISPEVVKKIQEGVGERLAEWVRSGQLKCISNGWEWKTVGCAGCGNTLEPHGPDCPAGLRGGMKVLFNEMDKAQNLPSETPPEVVALLSEPVFINKIPKMTTLLIGREGTEEERKAEDEAFIAALPPMEYVQGPSIINVAAATVVADSLNLNEESYAEKLGVGPSGLVCTNCGGPSGACVCLLKQTDAESLLRYEVALWRDVASHYCALLPKHTSTPPEANFLSHYVHSTSITKLEAAKRKHGGAFQTFLNTPDELEVPWDEIDEGIKWLVRALVDAGLDTFASCQGGEGHFTKNAFVEVASNPDELQDIAALVIKVAVANGLTDFHVSMTTYHKGKETPWEMFPSSVTLELQGPILQGPLPPS